jgi:hypothetical protein
MSLESTTTLTSAWSSVTNAAQNTGTVFNLSLPAGVGSNRFYRLRSN